MVKNLRAHIMLVCESLTLLPYRGYLEAHGWTLCFNGAQDVFCRTRLRVDGSVRQVAGPQGETQEAIWNGPNRRVAFAFLRPGRERLLFVKPLLRHPPDIFQ